ncbi:hypothetical protein RIF29_23944 [Crotalaria pallida]|uniref:Uncharacterized protein n=1 Tax=Crotalaria pallida TaxID=3830 RepID=A0AAN9I2S2_CROPI
MLVYVGFVCTSMTCDAVRVLIIRSFLSNALHSFTLDVEAAVHTNIIRCMPLFLTPFLRNLFYYQLYGARKMNCK